MKNQISISYTNQPGKERAVSVLKKLRINPIETTDTKVIFMATIEQEKKIALDLFMQTISS